ncbi:MULTISPECIES: DUF6252 family protein [Aquimarina]|uniref:DUF6252 family protein n=1 Tax=Aquimarina TaxID=290174 RepID=UPI000D698E38|nr:MULTISPECIES: DUF6252 family protein [Aquimarina]
MKKFLLLFVIVSVLSSCSKDDDSSAISFGRATLKIGSVEKVFTQANSFNNGVLTLGNTEEEIAGLFFPIPTTFPITYDMDTEDIITGHYIIGGKRYNATNGNLGIGKMGSLTITITAYSNSKISGTFEFIAISDDGEEIRVQQGVFDEIPDLDSIID